MVVPHSGGYPHAKFEGNLLLFKFEPHTKSGLTIPQCVRPRPRRAGARAAGGVNPGALRNSKSGFGMGAKFEE